MLPAAGPVQATWRLMLSRQTATVLFQGHSRLALAPVVSCDIWMYESEVCTAAFLSSAASVGNRVECTSQSGNSGVLSKAQCPPVVTLCHAVCATGYVVVVNATGDQSCKACPDGTTSDSDADYMNYCITAGPCAAGSYLAINSTEKTRLCKTCPAGTVSTLASICCTHVVVLVRAGGKLGLMPVRLSMSSLQPPTSCITNTC